MKSQKLVSTGLLILLTLVAVRCAHHQPPPPPLETPWSDDAIINMRHGWTVFTGPGRTLIGVNDEASITRGKALFSSHCQKCHGASGIGDGPYAKEHGLKPANLASISRLMPNHYLVVQITDGRGNMPSWKDLLDPQQTWDLTNYIQTLGKTEPKKKKN
jgi:mono/diheme cytochrome c family protein